jgi:PAS domain S-box-containing protein
MPDSRLREIHDTPIDGIILMGAGGTATMFEPACERMIGDAAAEIVGSDVKPPTPPPHHGEHDRYPENCRKTGRMFQRLDGDGKYPGVEAGLAICRRVAGQYGGELESVDCVEGASIELALPRAPVFA